MGLFSRKPASRADVIAWTSQQMRGRAESLEAQQITLQAERSGMSGEEIIWQFQTSQWPIVVSEADRHFKNGIVGMRARDLLTDLEAQRASATAAGQALFLLGADRYLPAVLEWLTNHAQVEGWPSR